MGNIRCTTFKDGTLFHTLNVNNKNYIIETVRTREQAKNQSRVNMNVSKSASCK